MKRSLVCGIGTRTVPSDKRPRHALAALDAVWLDAFVPDAIDPHGIPMKLVKYAKFREEKFGGVLFETRSEKVFALNPTAAALVREIGTGCDEASLVQRMMARFEDSGGTLEHDSVAFIANLRKQGLLED
jgi:hypothetical protein